MSMFDEEGIRSVDDRYTSRVAEIFNVTLKELGVSIDFLEDDYIGPINDTNLVTYNLNGKTILCSDYKFFIIERIDEIVKDIYSVEPVITEQDLRAKIIDKLENTKYLVGPTQEELKKLDIDDMISFVLK